MGANYTAKRLMNSGKASGLKLAADLARDFIKTHGDDLASSSLEALADHLDEERLLLLAELGQRP